MRAWLLLAAFLAIPLASEAGPKPKRATCQQRFEEPGERVALGSHGGVVFAKLGGRSAEFTPTRAQLEAMDAAVTAFVRDELFAADPLYAPIAMNRYLAAWTGVAERGAPLIYGFYANETMVASTGRRPYYPRGGDCFFCVWFDPASGTLTKIRVHPDG